MPVIFNDYMNTLMGDPTTERLKPLINAAADAGAEYFCIDSGWYAELNESWWDSVGAWVPSETRFPNGIAEVLELISARGMVPGLWIEPEVVGVRSAVAQQLPAEAFFGRCGQRVVEQGRYQLDLRHPRAREHLDQVVDRLVGLGVGYLKMDYNIDVAPGTDVGGAPAGAGLLGHNRAFLDWVDALLNRHPSLTVESCASGGMRTDYATLSRFQLHSTSDQQDLLRYPPIAAAAPLAVAPEQAAVWAYPQPEWDDDRIAFTLCTAMLGRLHLSGHLDRMAPAQQRLVAEAVTTYKRIRADVAKAVPFWPLGLPRWSDALVALGMRAEGATYVVLWDRRPSANRTATGVVPGETLLPINEVGGDASAEVLYPRSGAEVKWYPESGHLGVGMPRSPSACLIAVTP
jgi:alpha-galactosidase